MEKEVLLKKNETLDDLQVKGFKIIQNNDHFKFSIDAILLSHFTSFKKRDVVLDMCSGTGIVGLLVCAHNEIKRVDSIEIQEQLFDMCSRSVVYNNLKDKMFPYNIDLRDAPKQLGYEKYDTILCNPPYLPLSAGKSSMSEGRKIARFEVFGDLKDIISTSSKLLKNSGKLVLSHRPERLAEIIYLMKENKIEPKRSQFVHSQIDKRANILLIEGVKNARPNMIIEKPLIVYDKDNNYMDEINKIYNMDVNYE